jgi:hypothetical protein
MKTRKAMAGQCEDASDVKKKRDPFEPFEIDVSARKADQGAEQEENHAAPVEPGRDVLESIGAHPQQKGGEGWNKEAMGVVILTGPARDHVEQKGAVEPSQARGEGQGEQPGGREDGFDRGNQFWK